MASFHNRKSTEEFEQFWRESFDEKGNRRPKKSPEEKVVEEQKERRMALKKILLIGGGVVALTSIPTAAWFGWKAYESKEEHKRISQIFDRLAKIEVPDVHTDAFPVENSSKIIVLIEVSPYAKIRDEWKVTDTKGDADMIRHVCESLKQEGFHVHTVIGGCHTDGEGNMDLGFVQSKHLNMATMGVDELNHRYARKLKHADKHPFYAWDTLCEIAAHGDLSLASDEQNLAPIVTVALDRQQTITTAQKDEKKKTVYTLSHTLPQYLFEKGISVVRFKPTESFPEHIPDPKILP